jgi:hypothetical protein
MAYPDEVEVTDEWFVPHFPARIDYPLEMAMVKHWKEYMLYQDSFAGMWSTRLAAFLGETPRCLTPRQARTAMTFALWTAMPNGRSVDIFFERIKPGDAFSSSLGYAAAHAWSEVSYLSSSSRDLVAHLMRNEKGEYVYSDPPHPTLEDYRTMAATFTFLLSDKGRTFLRGVCNEAKIDWRYGLKQKVSP